ncbi:GumC family protein [Sagittula salina]|uniref:non-specific protein-tyrosine kinase n=1 Tax=Sagittula salina TaxID=2820268 RepID=A0A940S2V8_9RHOB|nr:polysaccharide biosynthesis tyrosine autokinase [Sagittula salina]MBP0484476.1 polysaccharide biosynthesis tyrosine autokinase [Sagittula salina]
MNYGRTMTRPGMPSGGDGEMQGNGELLNSLRLIWRMRWTVLAIAMIPLLLAAVYTYVLATPQYMARAQLALNIQSNEIIDVASLVSGASTESSAINTELEIIRSRQMIGAVVDELDLVNSPLFNLALRPPSWQEHVQLWIGELLGQEPPAPLPTSAVRERTINEVRRSVAAISRRGTYILEIQVTSYDRFLSAEVANTLADTYIREQIETKFESSEFAVDWLSERVSDLEGELFEKEEAVKDRRSVIELVDEEALNALVLRAKDLRSRVDRLAPAPPEANLPERLRDLRDAGDRAALTEALNDARLRRLLGKVENGDENAVATFDNLAGTLIEQRTRDLERDAMQRSALQGSLAEIEQRIEQQSRDLTELNQMQREAEATRVLYETFLSRLKEASLQIGFQRADSYVMEPALPGALVAPNPPLLLAMGLFLGLILGAGLVLMQQLMQQSARTASDLEQATGIMVLGQVPVLPIRRRPELINYLNDNPTSGPVEALRNLRTSILLADINNPPRIILSTSSVPGEGKTTQAIALAGVLSGIDKRVLLIGGDVRRRAIAEYFPGMKHTSLADVVTGRISLDEAVHHDDRLNVDVVTVGDQTVNPANLFSSDHFRAFLQAMREQYDFVVVDSPPILLVPDARILAQYADTVVVNVLWNRTPITQVKESIRQLSLVGVQPTGLVLSQVNTRKLARYSNDGAYGYYESYRDGTYN